MINSIRTFLKGQRLLLLAFLLLHTITSFYYIAHQDITFDEPHYIEYAKRWLHGHPERAFKLDDSKSPVVAIAWLPRMIKQVLQPGLEMDDLGRSDQNNGRYMMIFFSLLAALYVYKWCRQLFGASGWVFPLLLLLFDPLFIAYSSIITTDLACGAFLIALMYHFRTYLQRKSIQHFLLFAIYTALACLAKQSMLFILFLLPVIAWLYHFANNKKWHMGKALQFAALFLLSWLLVMNLGFYFTKTGLPLGDYSFSSEAFQTVYSLFRFLHWLPVPLPENYIYSLDMLQLHKEIGGGTDESSYRGVYLLGEYKMKGGFWYYYLVHLWYKMPLGTIVLMIISIITLARCFNLYRFTCEYQFLLLPIIYFFIVLSFFNVFQIGLRHLLVIYPLLFTGLGYVFSRMFRGSLKIKLLLLALVIFNFISVATYYPYIVPYTNELLMDKAKVYEKIYDSSIDYGQADSTANQLVKQYGSTPVAKPGTGKFVLLMGEILNKDMRDKPVYPWYQHLQPDSLVKGVILIYDITQKDLQQAGLQ